MCLPERSRGFLQPLKSEKCLSSLPRPLKRSLASDRNQYSSAPFWGPREGSGAVSLWLDEWGQLTKHRPVREHLSTWWPVSGQSRLRPSEWQVTQGERGTKHEVLRSCPKPPKSLSFFPKTVIFWSATIPKSLPSLWGTDYLSSSQTFPSKSWCNTSTWPLKKSERLHWSDHQLF